MSFELAEAAERGDLTLVKSLIANGANVHAYDDSALIWASNNGHLDVVKYLVSVGVDIHARDDYALRMASGNGHKHVVEYLRGVIRLRERRRRLEVHLG